MLTLVHAPLSRSFRMLWLLEELGADYDIRRVSIRRQDGSGAPDPNNPHPHGQVPALVHDGTVITESVAIALYLTDLFPGCELGRDLGTRARGPYLSWLAYYGGVVEPTAITHMNGWTADNAEAARLYKAMCDHVVATLEKQPYLVDDRPSSVDVILSSSLMWRRSLLPDSAAIDAYVARMAARPALARAQAKDGTEGN
ncbi:glutathione S-transferase [Rhizobium sp. ARZ01]|uniref:glutathione S-transferase family protein n=1 Tax=Rhizobium sp. ARZ01 TaxID=2769313 RepID=UPI00177B5256|nr:glutathione S-transferase [Rhizobium sp. ARZ01]MBD9372853.1 glutathione S-transferase [Rhizobium sp. ARZ01]